MPGNPNSPVHSEHVIRVMRQVADAIMRADLTPQTQEAEELAHVFTTLVADVMARGIAPRPKRATTAKEATALLTHSTGGQRTHKFLQSIVDHVAALSPSTAATKPAGTCPEPTHAPAPSPSRDADGPRTGVAGGDAAGVRDGVGGAVDGRPVARAHEGGETGTLARDAAEALPLSRVLEIAREVQAEPSDDDVEACARAMFADGSPVEYWTLGTAESTRERFRGYVRGVIKGLRSRGWSPSPAPHAEAVTEALGALVEAAQQHLAERTGAALGLIEYDPKQALARLEALERAIEAGQAALGAAGRG